MTRTEMIAALLAQCAEDKNTVEIPRGSNRGKRVEEMLRYTGLGGGYPWCAAAVAAWGIEALGTRWPVPRTADCDVLLAWARWKSVLREDKPERGDIFLVMKTRFDAIHTGIVVEVLDNDTVLTWEGNTNDGGSREGYGVFSRKRSRHNLWYVRWADAIEPAWSVTLPSGSWPRVEDRNGRPCSPVRQLVAALEGISLESTAEVVGWDAGQGNATVNGSALKGTYLRDGVAWAPVREIAEALGCSVSVAGQVVTVGPVSKELS